MAGDRDAESVRITIDLDPELHRAVKVWGVEANVRLAELTRALYDQLLADESLARKVKANVDRSRRGRPPAR